MKKFLLMILRELWIALLMALGFSIAYVILSLIFHHYVKWW